MFTHICLGVVGAIIRDRDGNNFVIFGSNPKQLFSRIDFFEIDE